MSEDIDIEDLYALPARGESAAEGEPVTIIIAIGSKSYAQSVRLPAGFPVRYQDEAAAVNEYALAIGQGVAFTFIDHFREGEGGDDESPGA